jgi:hypothetical protein
MRTLVITWNSMPQAVDDWFLDEVFREREADAFDGHLDGNLHGAERAVCALKAVDVCVDLQRWF